METYPKANRALDSIRQGLTPLANAGDGEENSRKDQG
jgi:hypothetical protein